MTTQTAGKWRLVISEPYPMFCHLYYDGMQLKMDYGPGFTHKDLRDLQYIVECAIVDCRNRMPPSNKHEMD